MNWMNRVNRPLRACIKDCIYETTLYITWFYCETEVLYSQCYLSSDRSDRGSKVLLRCFSNCQIGRDYFHPQMIERSSALIFEFVHNSLNFPTAPLAVDS